MAAVYKVGKKWRADWTHNEGARHRKRFDTKGAAEGISTPSKTKIKSGTYVAPKKIRPFGALADSWMTNRIEQSRTPGAGYRPSSLAQWQAHIAHMKFCFVENVKVSAIDPTGNRAGHCHVAHAERARRPRAFSTNRC